MKSICSSRQAIALGLSLAVLLGAARPVGAVEAATPPGAPIVAAPAQTDAKAVDAKAARKLALAQARFDWCSKAHAADAVKLEAQLKSIELKSAPDQLGRLRASDDYRKAYDAEGAFLANVPKSNATLACKPDLPGAKAK